jgi:N-acetylmuramoyl-L-alanine amidase
MVILSCSVIVGAAPLPDGRATLYQDKPLAGRKIVISPGHGWTYYPECDCYRLQRADLDGVIEDIVTAEIAIVLKGYLEAAGATVYGTRVLDKNAGTGASGHPKWQEGAREHMISLGLDEEIWNTGETTLGADNRSRPLYANFVGADMMISIHANAGGGSGSNAYYDTYNGHRQGSKLLAENVYTAMLSRIRANYDAEWIGRGVKGSKGYFVENRMAELPSVLVEVAFMDHEYDNAALKDPAFIQTAAQGIYEGILAYFAHVNQFGVPPVLPPDDPTPEAETESETESETGTDAESTEAEAPEPEGFVILDEE